MLILYVSVRILESNLEKVFWPTFALCLHLSGCAWAEQFWSRLVQFGHPCISSKYIFAWDTSASGEKYKRYSDLTLGPRLFAKLIDVGGDILVVNRKCEPLYQISQTPEQILILSVSFRSITVQCFILKSKDNSSPLLILTFMFYFWTAFCLV